MRGAAFILMFVVAHAASAALSRAAFDEIGFRPPPGAYVAGNALRDASGRALTLRSLARGRPLVLLFGYYDCDALCPSMLTATLAALAGARLEPGRDFDFAFVSINPRETPADAHKKAAAVRAGYPALAAHADFLTGDARAIAAVARSVGLVYAYDAARKDYAHPAGLVLLGPGGRIARYLNGLPNARALRLAVVDVGRGRVGSWVDQLWLRCYHYDASTGRYTPAVMRAVRVGGLLVVAALAMLLWRLGPRS